MSHPAPPPRRSGPTTPTIAADAPTTIETKEEDCGEKTKVMHRDRVVKLQEECAKGEITKVMRHDEIERLRHKVRIEKTTLQREFNAPHPVPVTVGTFAPPPAPPSPTTPAAPRRHTTPVLTERPTNPLRPVAHVMQIVVPETTQPRRQSRSGVWDFLLRWFGSEQ